MNPIQQQLKPLLINYARPENNRDEKNNTESSQSKNNRLDFFSRLNEIDTQAVQNRKSAAKARMAELKQRIDNMMRFSFIGKGNPRMVAELAKELKALVAQYGGSAGAAMTAPTSEAPPSNASDQTNAAQTIREQAQASAAAAADVAAQASDKASKDEQANKTPAEQSTEQNQRSDGTQKNTQAHRQSGDAGDKEFFAEVKKLSDKLKQLLAMENRQLKTERDQQELREAKKTSRPSQKRYKKPKPMWPLNKRKLRLRRAAQSTAPAAKPVLAAQAIYRCLPKHRRASLTPSGSVAYGSEIFARHIAHTDDAAARQH
jgi:hypothetical protein